MNDLSVVRTALPYGGEFPDASPVEGPAASGTAALLSVRPFVEIRDLDLRYGGKDGTLALKGMSLDVAQGEFVAVVGPSGCGKSTLMKAVTGLWPASSGSVIVAGREVAGPLSIVGMAFQNSIMLPWRTTLANVMLPLEVVDPHKHLLRANRAEYEHRARELLELVGLGDFADRFPWQLSGGMQQRASLCRALVHEPTLLMLDEPFGALDAFTREELWMVLEELYLARRPTVVIVTHDLREAVFLADRVVVMSARPGRILHSEQIELARPRRLDDLYAREVTERIRRLREKIDEARREEKHVA